MKRNWKKWTEKALSAALIAAMAAAYLPAAKGAEAEAAEASAGGTTYEGELNAMTDEEYAKFGLANSSPDEFDPEDTSNPLDEYESITPTELFVGYGNKTSSYEAEFFIADNVTESSASAFSLDTMDDKLIGKKVDLDEGSKNIHALAECGADIDGDGTDELITQEIYSIRNSSRGSEVRLYAYDYDEAAEEWVKISECSTSIHDSSSEWTTQIRTDSTECLTGLTAGDFNGDGKEEVVMYYPIASGRLYMWDGKSKEDAHYVMELSDLNDENNSYNHITGFTQSIVSLSTTSISGRDDLVINISKPLTSSGEFSTSGQSSLMAIYRYSMGWECEYRSSLTYGSTRMRFCSSTDTDVNGNGIEELLIGGYKNTEWSTNNDVGILDASKNLIQLICWNETEQKYEEVWDAPKEVEALANLPLTTVMTEPAALAAGRFHADSDADQVFLEGVVSKFAGGEANGASEKERLSGGSFSTEYKAPIDNLNAAFISTACAGTFSTNGRGAEQLVFVAGDFQGSSDHSKVYLDVYWIWENGDKNLTGSKSDNDYLKGRASQGEGSFLTLCALDADEDTVQVQYEGKTYGWSDPTLYCVLQSPPYWSELQYNSETYGAGEVSYSISYGSSTGQEREHGVSLGFFLEASAVIGPSFFGNGVQVGGGFDFSGMKEQTESWGTEHEVNDSVEFIVAPGEDQAIILAIPLVIYHYKIWIPEYEVTQEEVDAYNELRKENPALDPYPYEEGEIAPGSWQEYDVQMQLEPAFSNIPIETYNELAEEYKDSKGLRPVTEETLASKTIGDPSTYPGSEAEIKEPGNVENLHISRNAVRTISSESGKKLTYEIAKDSTHAETTAVNYDGSLYAKAELEGKIPFVGETSGEVAMGFKWEQSDGCTSMNTSTNGMEFSTTICDMPKGSDDYSFTTQLAVFNNTDLPMGGGQTDAVNKQGNAYCVGYIVTGVDAPPKTAVDLRVFATTEHEVALKWDTSSYRPAQSWEVFVEDPVTGQEHSLGITNDTYYVATHLDPGTTYRFALKAYEEEDGRGDASVISRWVSAITKDSSSSAPYFIKQPQRVVVAPDDGEVHTMTAEAQIGEGMDGAVLTYQWQKYTHAHLTGEGTWENIDGATQAVYQLPKVTSENVGEFEEQTHYRVVATQTKGSNIKSAISKVATMYINSDGSEHDFYELQLGLSVSGEQVSEQSGDYYTSDGTADFAVTISPADADGKTPLEGIIQLMYCDESGKEIGVLGSGSFADGERTCDISVKEIPTGIYKVYASYLSIGPDGSGDIESFYLPAQSDPVTLHSVEEYRITYHMNGGINHSANPTVLTNESAAVVLEDPTRNYYTFNGWYLDEALTQPLENNTVDPLTLTGDVDLYAGWEAVSWQIAYELNGGTNSPDNPASYTVEDTVILKDAAKDGCRFLGWYTQGDFSGNPVEKIDGAAAADVTLYAKWEEIEVPFDRDDETGAYLISSYEDLTAMAQKIQDNPSQYGAATYIQTCNINCGEREWTLPLGTQEHPFQGIYEGEDYYILGLRPVNGSNGLFGVIGESGMVKNLSVIDFDYSETPETAGGIAGINRGKIIGCGSGINLTSAATIFRNGEAVPIYTLNSDIKGICVGGIAGRNEGVIQDSRSNAAVSGTCAGGIAGENTGTILNVYNVGTVAGTNAAGSTAGGIAGKNSGEGKLQYGYNAAAVTGAAAGGIAGTSDNTNIRDLWYLSDITAACTNQEDGALTVGRKTTAEMKTQEFCDTLNHAIEKQKEELGLRDWVYGASENEGYPRLTREVVVQQTLTNEKLGISVSGLIHPGATLKLEKLSSDHAEYKSVAEALKSGKLLEGWKLSLVYADGTYSTWEGKLTVTLKPETKEKLKDLSIFHQNDKGDVLELKTQNDGEQLIVQTNTLGSFCVVKGETGSQTTDNQNGSSQNNKSTVKTGDTANPAVLIFLLLVSGGIIILLFIRHKKRRS